ncbi:MAG TPA: ATP-binding protein [Anaerolineales bacterium]|nr:ATP-binding protein [Anaerolineales bacterium]
MRLEFRNPPCYNHIDVFPQIFTLLTTPPGNLTYHLVLIFSILVVLMAAFGHWRTHHNPKAGRAVVGLLLLVASRLFLTILAGIALTGLFTAALILPPTDRAMTSLGLVLIIWLWGFPDFSRGGDIASILTLMLGVTLGVLSLVVWAGQPSGIPFNMHWLSLGWEIFSIILLVFGLLLLLVRRPALWGMGFGMFLILLIGHIAEAFFGDPTGSYPAAVRLSQLVAFPLLFTLTQRMFTREEQSPESPLPEQFPIPTVAPPPPRVPVDPALFADLFTIATERNADQLYPAIVRAVARALQGDICLMVLPPTPVGDMLIRAGYNQVRKENLPQGTIKANEVPRLASAIRQGQSIRLLLQNTSVDLLNLSSILNTSRTGNLIAAPIELPDMQGALVLYSPYSEYVWKDEDEKALAQVGTSLSKMIQGNQHQESTGELVEQLQVELSTTLAEREQILREKEALAKEVTGLREQKANPSSAIDEKTIAQLKAAHDVAQTTILALETEKTQIAQDLEDLKTRQDELATEKEQAQKLNAQLKIELDEIRALSRAVSSPNGQELIKQLQEENENLRQEMKRVEAQLHVALADTPMTESQLEHELRSSLKENARLQKMLGEYEVKIFQMERQIQASKTSERWETIVTVAQEMRQPMSSVVGYSDFLLSESIGILGALQRKFLERVKASTERMISMIEELVQIASVEAGHTKLNVGSLDLMRAIDAAISDTSSAIREKNISLRMNIPDNLPKIQGDYEAVHLILTNLLQNAGTVTPEEGEISINVGYESYGDDQDYVVVQIADSGGGIPSEDLQRVFGEQSERAGSKTGAIRGLGSSTLGLAFTKTLVEAHGGRIWVETEFEKGSTFSVLLPLSNEIPVSILANWRS